MENIEVEIHTAEIRLDGLLKFAAVVGTGGEAKYLIQSGLVAVNEDVDRRRSRKVRAGDRVFILDEENPDEALVEIYISGPGQE